MSTLFDPLSINDNHFLLASHTPPGKAWEKVFDKDDDFGKLFLGLAVEFYRFQVLEKKLFDEMDIRQANELLIEWEKSVGLPDSCFITEGESVETRRIQIEQKFSSFGGVQEKEDFIRVADIFGYDISIKTGKQVGFFPLQFPIALFSDAKAVTHTFFIVINEVGPTGGFPLPFPIPFDAGENTFLQCIFDKLAPANVKVIIINEGDL